MNDSENKKRKPRTTHILSEDEIRKNVAELKRVGSKEKQIILAFSERLNKLLEEEDISQELFATRIGGSAAVVSKYRSGRGIPKSSALVRMSKVLNVSTDYLLGLSELKSRNDEEKVVYKVTGLSDDAIKVLKEHKLEAVLPPLNSPRLAAINYLIEQDLETDSLAGDKLRLLSDIADYLSIHADAKNKHSITYKGIGELKDSDGPLINAINTKAVAFDDEIVDTILIGRITDKLKELKKSYQRYIR